MVSFAILMVDPVQNLEKYKKWLNVLIAAERAKRDCRTIFEPSFLSHMDPMTMF